MEEGKTHDLEIEKDWPLERKVKRGAVIIAENRTIFIMECWKKKKDQVKQG